MQNPQANRTAVIISVLFNAYWFLCVVIQEPAWFLLLALLIAAVAFDKTVAVVAPIIAFIGISGDIALTGLGIFVFDDTVTKLSEAVSSFPLWLVFLWLGFGAYAWLLRAVLKKYMGALFILVCSISGSTSYYAGMKLGAVDFSASLTTTLMLLLVLWAAYGWFFATLIGFFSTRVFKEADLNLQDSHKSILSVDLKY